MDTKGWQSWTGTSGTSANPTVTSSATGVYGATLDATDPAGQAKTKLNAYVTANSPYIGTALMTWIDGGLYPKLTRNATGINEKIKLQPDVVFSINNGILSISRIDKVKYLKIYTVSGTQLFSDNINSEFYLPLRKGIYLVIVDGNVPVKLIVR